jgi:hypothetical protein
MSLVPEPSPFRVAGLRDGGLHPFPTLDAEPGERADLGTELDRLGLGEVAGVVLPGLRLGRLRDAPTRITLSGRRRCRPRNRYCRRGMPRG